MSMKLKLTHVLAIAALTALLLNIRIFNAGGDGGNPPQASFIYWPAKPYLNQTVNLDASSSTAEDFNSSIAGYEWTFGDGTPEQSMTNPTINHAYQQTGTFVVALNVTSTDGLWCLTSKPITIFPEFGPTASFTWSPTSPVINDTVTFDASGSTLGWSAKTQRFSPIQTYAWNFSDGTGIKTTSSALITHIFTKPESFTVKLTVTDADGRSSQASATVTVQNATAKLYDENKDGKINLVDVFATALAFGSVGPDYYYPGSPASPNWNPACDFNHDGTVNLKDYLGVALHFGQDP
jgi:PKD repeat protein